MAGIRAIVTRSSAFDGLLEDRYAEHFVVGRYHVLMRLLRRVTWLPHKVIDLLNPGAVTYIAVRHRCFDDEIARARKDGIDTVMLLGAGFDSRAYRFANQGIRFIEIDHPDTQRIKRRVVDAKGFGERPGVVVRYYPVDFETASLASVLEEIPRARMLIIWEGVAWYLSEETVRSTLTALRGCVSVGSRLVFDAIEAGVADGTRQDFGARAHRRYTERRGEPIIWGIEQRDLGDFLGELSWTLVDVEEASDAAKRLLSPGASVSPPLPFHFFVRASA